ncbi:GAF domain-containing protein [Bradyrhizobium ganzhouense]|uniref:GAF domain-containing sensor histidine kinase n=1 Tax=Bradyrhizobium ganzhouense TaxID=1179767 RepID=UPI003CEE2656
MARISRAGDKTSKARNARQAKGGEIAKAKRPATPKPRKGRSVAELELQLERQARELYQALERQTATADILKVIASSPDDVQPVFDAIAERSNRLLNGVVTAVYRLVDDVQHLMAFTPTSPEADAALKSMFPRPLSAVGFGETIRNGQIALVPDIESEAAVPPTLQDVARMRGWRSALLVPLLRDNRPIGLISVTRAEPGPFADHHVELLQTFADQAAIAISNVELFKEVRERTVELTESLEQQTATSEVLQVISLSLGELEPVFRKMLENATRVCGATFGTMNLWDGESFKLVADYNVPPAFADWRRQVPIRPHPAGGLAAVVRSRQPVQLVDVREGPAYLARDPAAVAIAEIACARTILTVPMLKESELIGTITIFRQEVRPFTEKQIALVENFTRQAVIAIENTRLLRELRERTDELTRSLEDLRTAQDRLIQTEKLASLGQLTAGIAHEIKNPLNFVNNFSALSAELVDELDETLAPAALDQKLRGDVSELTAMLKSNLEKVVQHGKRADSIVKNMLLHSREGSGERRPTNVNALVEESLNLAYHGARAEKSEFNIKLTRDLDPDVGSVELYPQEITRALLNLISNAFYAATKRKSEAADETLEPTLAAITKNLGNRVEIRIRDNGTGIPPDVKQKMFNPFFTTKPAGEGTGLGLSMSHDIIVKQHGGTIDVETEPGSFTEFIIALPRNAAAQASVGREN